MSADASSSKNTADGMSSGSVPTGPPGESQEARQFGAGSERDLVDRYWRRNAGTVTAVLLVCFAVSLLPIGFATLLNTIVVSGVPFGHYMGVQGTLAIFVLLTAGYAARTAFDDRRRDLRAQRGQGS